jgi:FixJ family two-component response regulator
MVSGGFLVAVVDDDVRVLELLGDLLESAGYSVRSFNSAQSLLADSGHIPPCRSS